MDRHNWTMCVKQSAYLHIWQLSESKILNFVIGSAALSFVQPFFSNVKTKYIMVLSWTESMLWRKVKAEDLVFITMTVGVLSPIQRLALSTILMPETCGLEETHVKYKLKHIFFNWVHND